MPRLAYLGPEGTFTEAALRSLPHARGAELVPCAGVPAALEAVRSGAVAAAMVPIENTVEGAVNATLDELAGGRPLVIVAEAVLPVAFALLARPGTTRQDVRSLATHPHAQAQCRAWLAAQMPSVRVEPTASTAAAAAAVAAGAHDAAIAAPVAAEHYGLVAIATGIGDNPDAQTRFVLVGRPGTLPRRTGADKTTLVAFIRDDHPGALLEVLEEFSVRGVNLSRIESRPTGEGFGRYCFSIDADGHLDDARVGEALMGLRRVCADVRFLGSYPRADGQQPVLRHGVTDADFAAAAEWLESLRG